MSRTLDNPLWTAQDGGSASMAALADVLSKSTGFSLWIVRITSDRHRQRLEQDLVSRVRALQPELRLHPLTLKPPIDDLVEIMSTAVATERPDALLISGLEMAFADLYSDHGVRLLKRLDEVRDQLGTAVPCPLLMWVSSPLLEGLALFAPLLVRDRSRLLYFDEPEPALELLLDEIHEAQPAQIPALDERLQAQAGRCILPPDLGAEAPHVTTLQMRRLASGLPREPIRSFLRWPVCGIVALFTLGGAALRARSFELALLFNDKAARIAAAAEVPSLQIRAHFHLGDAYQGLDLLAHALDAYRFALMQAKRFGETQLAERAAKGLQKLCAQQLERIGPQGSIAQNPVSVPPVRATAVRSPTAASLRPLLDIILPTEGDFDFFLTEHLLDFAAQHSMILSRQDRTELLFQQVEPGRILEALERTDRKAVERYAELLVPSEPAGDSGFSS